MMTKILYQTLEKVFSSAKEWLQERSSGASSTQSLRVYIILK